MGKEKAVVDQTEKGFGTGLRAQLERRRDALAAVDTDAGVEQAAAAAQVLAENVNGFSADLDSVRSELAASLAREEGLRAALSDQIQTNERGLDIDQELAERAADLDARAGQLAKTKAELEERERRLTDELRKLHGGEKELHETRSRLAADER
jgi:DNA repair exonuclease SbcCD ATPase subunit